MFTQKRRIIQIFNDNIKTSTAIEPIELRFYHPEVQEITRFFTDFCFEFFDFLECVCDFLPLEADGVELQEDITLAIEVQHHRFHGQILMTYIIVICYLKYINSFSF